MQRATLWIITIQFFFWGSIFSSNFHEHLFSLPFEKNFSNAITKITSGNLKISTSKVFENKDQWDFVYEEIKAPELKEYYDIYKHQSLDVTLKELSSEKACQFFSAIFKTANYQNLPLKERKLSYQINENLRKEIFLKGSLEDITQIFKGYLEDDPIENRYVISATCTERFFQDPEKAEALLHLAHSYHTKLIYRISLKRSLLLHGAALPISPNYQVAISKGLVHGIDLVSSMHEQATDFPSKEEDIFRALNHLFDFATEKNIIVFLHIFENTNEGSFYKALRRALCLVHHPLKIEVGHINYLNEEWMHFFTQHPYIKPAFICCPASANFLHDISTHSLDRITRKIKSLGFDVFLGSDGRGILPHSSYLELSHLIEDSYKEGHLSFLAQEDDNALLKKLKI